MIQEESAIRRFEGARFARLTAHGYPTAESLVKYFETYIWTARNRAQVRVPDIDSHATRQHSGGMTIGIDLIEFADHIELPKDLLNSEPFRVLATTTNNVVCWSNDIFSLEKEQARGER